MSHMSTIAPGRDLRLLILGECRGASLRRMWEAIGDVVRPAEMRCAAEIRPGLAWIEDEGWYPDLVLVCQQTSQQFSPGDVTRLVCRLPLARVVCAYGPWCDSDGRTHSHWPLALRVPVADLPTRLRYECQVLSGRAGVPWLPVTGSRTEIFAAHYDPVPLHAGVAATERLPNNTGSTMAGTDRNGHLPQQSSEQLAGQHSGQHSGQHAQQPRHEMADSATVRVVSADRAWREMLATFLHRCGWQVVAEDWKSFESDPIAVRSIPDRMIATGETATGETATGEGTAPVPSREASFLVVDLDSFEAAAGSGARCLNFRPEAFDGVAGFVGFWPRLDGKPDPRAKVDVVLRKLSPLSGLQQWIESQLPVSRRLAADSWSGWSSCREQWIVPH